MIPLSLSATAVDTAQMCLRRFGAEHLGRSKGVQNDAALLGSTCHAALESYVQDAYLDTKRPRTLETLLTYFDMYYDSMMPSDRDDPAYPDGRQMLTRWHARQGDYLDDPSRTVLMVEQKLNFEISVRAPSGDKFAIPFNFIWDRFDQIGEDEYEVIDYKSNRWSKSPDDLRRMVQPRSYSLAARIMYPNAKRIWVRFDYLRHDTAGTVFDRDEDTKTYRSIQKVLRDILNAGDNPQPTLNPACNFCSAKSTCPLLTRNVAGAGIMSLSPEEQIDRRSELADQKAGLEAAIRELDTFILERARLEDVDSFTTDKTVMKIKVTQRRSVDADSIRAVVGDKIFELYGGSASMSMKDFDSLRNAPDLEDSQRKALERLISKKFGSPSVSTSPVGFAQDES